MKLRTLFGIFLFAVFLGAGNNLVNVKGISWLGSAEVLPKPEGWPSLTVAQGITAGLKVAKHDALENGIPVLIVIAWLLVLIRSAVARHKPVSGAVISWLRITLGMMFLIAAFPKFADPKGFSVLVTQYQLLPSFAVNLFSVMLPAFEITTGLVLILTPFEQEGTVALFLLLLMFVVALSQALARGLGVACGCFDIEGAADAGETWFSLLRDIVLLVPVVWMFFKARRRFLAGFLRNENSESF